MAENKIIVTRRSLLQTTWRAAALASLASAFPQFSFWKRTKQNLKDVTAESFRPYAGRDMVFSRPAIGTGIISPTVKMKLAEVTVHESAIRIESRNPAKYAKRSREPFSLVFELKEDAPLDEGLHRLMHPDFTGDELFLSQVTQLRPDGTLLYEAVFG
jgi:hypothetical protein